MTKRATMLIGFIVCQLFLEMSLATAQSTTEIPPSSTDLSCSIAPCAESAAIAQVRLEDILSDLRELESSFFGVEVEVE